MRGLSRCLRVADKRFQLDRSHRCGFKLDRPVLLNQLRDGVFQRLNPLTGNCRDGEELHFAAFCEGGELLQLLGIGDIGFGCD